MATKALSFEFTHVTTVLQDLTTYKKCRPVGSKVHTYIVNVVGGSFQNTIFQIAPDEETAMARFQNSTFASVQLNQDDEKKLTDWIQAEGITGPEAMNRLLGCGFKLSVSWIPDQNAFCFSVIGTDNTKTHKNMVMTSWSDDLDEVAAIAAYKHFVVCDEGTWPTRADGPRWG